MEHLFIFGLGYSAKPIRAALEARGWHVTASGSAGDMRFDEDDRIRRELARASHVLSSIPPSASSDPVIDRYGDALGDQWLGYLSSTGVYGDTKGAWADESAALVGLGGSGRRIDRARCDTAWLERGARVFRLPGIYGPGRSALDRVAAGKARRTDVPGQVFSRVHVADVASGVIAGIAAPPGAYNLADDLPCSQNAVVEQACRLIGTAPPALLPLDQAGLSPAARAFYDENRRIANGKAKRVLGWRPSFPDYRSGLYAIWRGG